MVAIIRHPPLVKGWQSRAAGFDCNAACCTPCRRCATCHI